jgi:hypothetical protein
MFLDGAVWQIDLFTSPHDLRGIFSLGLQGTKEEKGRKHRCRRRRRRGSGRAATTAARARSRSRRSASAWTRCAAGATRRAGTASSPPSASTRPSTSAWTASPTSASGVAAPSPPTDLTQPTGQPTHRGDAHLPPPATKNLAKSNTLCQCQRACQFLISRGSCLC